MTRRIPPLNPLRAFEAVARAGSLTAAAAELHVTQSAVSRQIGALEEYLGVPLFRRERYGVSLTRAGKGYAEQVIPAFESIATATEKLTRGARRGELRVHTYTTFAAKWLIPRLGEFRRLHPQIDVRLTDAVAPVNFARDAVDVAIQFGNGQWPRVHADLLLADCIEPVCSPDYVARNAPDPERPQELLRGRLLVSHYRRADWDDWLHASGLAEAAANAERMGFKYSMLALQAAVDGLGVAMGQIALLGDELASGRLARPFRKPVWRPMGYYLLRPRQSRESRKVLAFRDWLLALRGDAPAEADTRAQT